MPNPQNGTVWDPIARMEPTTAGDLATIDTTDLGGNNMPDNVTSVRRRWSRHSQTSPSFGNLVLEDGPLPPGRGSPQKGVGPDGASPTSVGSTRRRWTKPVDTGTIHVFDGSDPIQSEAPEVEQRKMHKITEWQSERLNKRISQTLGAFTTLMTTHFEAHEHRYEPSPIENSMSLPSHLVVAEILDSLIDAAIVGQATLSGLESTAIERPDTAKIREEEFKQLIIRGQKLISNDGRYAAVIESRTRRLRLRRRAAIKIQRAVRVYLANIHMQPWLEHYVERNCETARPERHRLIPHGTADQVKVFRSSGDLVRWWDTVPDDVRGLFDLSAAPILRHDDLDIVFPADGGHHPRARRRVGGGGGGSGGVSGTQDGRGGMGGGAAAALRTYAEDQIQAWKSRKVEAAMARHGGHGDAPCGGDLKRLPPGVAAAAAAGPAEHSPGDSGPDGPEHAAAGGSLHLPPKAGLHLPPIPGAAPRAAGGAAPAALQVYRCGPEARQVAPFYFPLPRRWAAVGGMVVCHPTPRGAAAAAKRPSPPAQKKRRAASLHTHAARHTSPPPPPGASAAAGPDAPPAERPPTAEGGQAGGEESLQAATDSESRQRAGGGAAAGASFAGAAEDGAVRISPLLSPRRWPKPLPGAREGAAAGGDGGGGAGAGGPRRRRRKAGGVGGGGGS